MTNAEVRFNKIHIRKVYACLAVTCHLHFWQNDRDFLRATAVTRGGTDTEIRVSTVGRPWSYKILPLIPAGIRTRRPVNHESGALTTATIPAPRSLQVLTSTYKLNLPSRPYKSLFCVSVLTSLANTKNARGYSYKSRSFFSFQVTC